MTALQFYQLVKRYCGVIEGGFVIFPTVHQKRMFEEALSRATET